MDCSDVDTRFWEQVTPYEDEFADFEQKSVSFGIYFASHAINQTIYDEQFGDLTSNLDGRQMMYNDARNLRYVTWAARNVLNETPRCDSAVRLATRGLVKTYGFTEAEVNAILQERVLEEARNDALLVAEPTLSKPSEKDPS